MNKLAVFFHRLLEKQKACMAVCLIISLISGSICAATVLDVAEREDLLPGSVANVSRVEASEPVSAGSADDDCMYVFYSAWEGYDFKP